MAASINTNIMAMNTANTLNGHYGRLSTSVERLSSGLRVNSAADDAAGLAIRELMRADIAAMNQGTRNANDAISMLQVADGALAIIDEKLIRMKELAEQAATGTYDSTQRLMIDSEFQAMGAEIDRIANATDFNGIKLLDGSLSGTHNGRGMNSTGAMKIHFGTANDSAEDYYYVEIGDCSTKGLGLRELLPFPAAPPSVSWINEAQIDYAGRHIILDITDAIAGRNPSAFQTGLDFYQLPVGLENITITSNAVNPHPFHKPHVSLFDSSGMQFTGLSPSMGMPVDIAPGQQITTTGSAWWNGISTDKLIANGIAQGVFDSDARYTFNTIIVDMLQPGFSWNLTSLGITVSTPTGINEIGSQWHGLPGLGTAQDEIIELSEITSDLVFFIGGHDNPGGGCNRYKLRIEADITDEFIQKLKGWAGDGGPGLTGGMLSIETQEKAQNALVTVQDAIVKKDEIRAHLGALQNRFENTVTNLTTQAENLQASESRISDADVALEMMNFVRNQVLTQSAVAMLGQANSYPHMLASLLNG